MAKIFILFLLLLIHISSYAQNLISGTVSDKETKEVLIGANVVVKNTATGTATNLDGSFQINIGEKLPATLIISYLGYIEKEVVINTNEKNKIIMLSPENQR